MYMYVHRQCARKKIRPHTYIRVGSRTPTRAYVRPGLMYMAGSERRNCVVFLFMGRQRNASCSWGGNKMRRVLREATEYVMFIGSQPAWTEQPIEARPGVPQNGGNGLVFNRPRSKQDPIHRVGSGVPQNGGNRLVLDLLWSKQGPVDREGCGVPQNGGNGPPTVETGVLLIGRAVAYRKTDETDLLRSKRGSC